MRSVSIFRSVDVVSGRSALLLYGSCSVHPILITIHVDSTCAWCLLDGLWCLLSNQADNLAICIPRYHIHALSKNPLSEPLEIQWSCLSERGHFFGCIAKGWNVDMAYEWSRLPKSLLKPLDQVLSVSRVGKPSSGSMLGSKKIAVVHEPLSFSGKDVSIDFSFRHSLRLGPSSDWMAFGRSSVFCHRTVALIG